MLYIITLALAPLIVSIIIQFFFPTQNPRIVLSLLLLSIGTSFWYFLDLTNKAYPKNLILSSEERFFNFSSNRYISRILFGIIYAFVALVDSLFSKIFTTSENFLRRNNQHHPTTRSSFSLSKIWHI